MPPAKGPVSVIIMNGSRDTVAAFCATPSPVQPTADDAFAYWSGALANKCATSNPNRLFCPNNTLDTTLMEKDATQCLAGTTVVFYDLVGGNHLWQTGPLNVPPGTTASPYNSQFVAPLPGVTTNDIAGIFRHASETIRRPHRRHAGCRLAQSGDRKDNRFNRLRRRQGRRIRPYLYVGARRTPPATVAFSINGSNAAKATTATFTKAGLYNLQVTIKNAAKLTATSRRDSHGQPGLERHHGHAAGGERKHQWHLGIQCHRHRPVQPGDESRARGRCRGNEA